MRQNAVPHYDDSVNTTGCCPKFNPEGWNGQSLHFRDKLFVHATTRSAMHIPLNMGTVFSRVQGHIEETVGWDNDNMLVLSHDASPWEGEHLFAVNGPVEGEEMTTLSGDYITRVFEGPYKDAKHWHGEMQKMVRDRGHQPGQVYFFYTTCPKCAKAYGKNYVVGVAELGPPVT